MKNEQMADFVTYIISTFKFAPSNEGEDLTVYEVTIEDSPELKAVSISENKPDMLATDDDIAIMDNDSDSSNTEISNADEDVEESIYGSVETMIDNQENNVINNIETSEEQSEILDTVETEETTELIVVNEEESIVVSEETDVTNDENEVVDIILGSEEVGIVIGNPLIIPTNQTEIVYEEDKAYTSTIYSMLKVSQIGYMNIINQNAIDCEQGFIQIVSVNRTEETEKLIKEYIMSGDAYYSSMESPPGCHWESIIYNVKYPDPNGLYYTNIEFVGLDGEPLKYKGVQYSKRTYDISNRAIHNDGWEEGFIAFYAVPNGCTQYAIACGDTLGEGYQAYYKIGE